MSVTLVIAEMAIRLAVLSITGRQLLAALDAPYGRRRNRRLAMNAVLALACLVRL